MKNMFGILWKKIGLVKVKSTAKLTEIAKMGLLVLLSMNMPWCKTDPFENSLENFDKGLLPEKKDFNYDPQLHSNLNNYLDQFREKLLEKAKDTSFLQSNNIVLEKDANTTEMSFEHDSTQYAITVSNEPLSGGGYIKLIACSGNSSRVFKIYLKKFTEEQNVLSITGTDTTTVVNKIPFYPSHLDYMEKIVWCGAKKMKLIWVGIISWEPETDSEYLRKLKPVNDFWQSLQMTISWTRSMILTNGLILETEWNEMIYRYSTDVFTTISVRFSKNKEDGIVLNIDEKSSKASNKQYLISMNWNCFIAKVDDEYMSYEDGYKKLLENIEIFMATIPMSCRNEFNDSKAEKILKD